AFCGSARLFAHDFLRLFVLPQTLKRRMPDDAFVSPFTKSHFTYQLRLRPDCASQTGIDWYDLKGSLFPCNPVQLLLQINSQLVAETRADTSGVDQFSLVVNSEHQRAERKALVRQRISRNHEFLPAQALHLQPVSTPRRLIR